MTRPQQELGLCRQNLAVGAFFASLFSVQTILAVPLLEVQLFNSPDVLVQAILVDYDSSTDLLTANGTAVEFDDDGVGASEPITDGVFSLESTINDIGFSSGSMLITGTIPNLGFNSGTLLSGILTDGGTPPPPGSTEQLHFTFDITGGDLAQLYIDRVEGIGFPGGGIIMTSTGFPGDFSMDFTNEIVPPGGVGDGSADVGVVVPEPTSVAICFLLLGPWAMLTRWSNKIEV